MRDKTHPLVRMGQRPPAALATGEIFGDNSRAFGTSSRDNVDQRRVSAVHARDTKEAGGVAGKRLELALTFGVPHFLRSDPGTEFLVEGFTHICRWLT